MPVQLDKQPDMTLLQEGGWWYRAGMHDPDLCTVRSAYINDEYHLTDHLPRRAHEVVVDVGACIGAFSRLAHVRNPTAKILAVEANPKNIPVLTANVGGVARVVPAALTYEPNVGLLDSIYEGTEASGGSAVKAREEIELYAGSQYIPQLGPIEQLTLEQLIEQQEIDFIDVLKLDCEGSEYSILGETTSLSRIGLIVGEYHGGRSRWEALVHNRFPAELWLHLMWNHHDHMGTFLLANLQGRRGDAVTK